MPELTVRPSADSVVSRLDRASIPPHDHPGRNIRIGWEKAETVAVKVRVVIATLQSDGWVLSRTKGDHRQFIHPTKPGTVTVSGQRNQDVPPGTLASIERQSGLKFR
jgi:predicted RNA binding protein YcfA (HicA-like mRNA interferase family)